MTEKEKMIAGKPYFADNEVLVAERLAAKEITFDYNETRPSELTKRNLILKKLLGKTGSDFYFEPPFQCDYGYNIEIGENFYSNHNLIILDCAKVTIGNSVFIAPNVGIYTAGHPIDPEFRAQGYEHAHPISIEDNVWIGGHVSINPGVTIGKNSVIGSGSVVTKDIPANVIAVGNPCEVLREITSEDRKQYKNQIIND